jgi:hypothetical protein
MNESSSDQDTSTEVLAEEEDLRGDFHPLDLFSNDWEAGTKDGSKKHNDFVELAAHLAILREHLQTAATCRGKS